MARNIDADALMEELKSLSITVTGFRGGKCYLSKIVEEYKDSVLRIIDEQPTADVAPRSEIAREIFGEIGEYAEQQIEALSIAEKVDPRGIDFFDGGKQAFVLLLDRLAELKKKYTGEQT